MPGLHCPRPDRLGDSRQALPAVWHRGELARLVSQVPVTHYEKLRRHANDFHLVSMHRAPEPSTWQCIEFGNIALQLGSWLKTIWQTVWRWRLRFRHPLLYFFGLGWIGASNLVLTVSCTASVGPTKASSHGHG
jgi:hypothetical protein